MIKQNEASQLIDAIADGLGEQIGTGAYTQISKCVSVLGGRQVLTFAQEALSIQDRGGMLTHDKSRRRTLGGVFFVLVKKRVTDEQFQRIFGRQRRKRQPATPSKKPVVQPIAQQPKKPATPAQSWRKTVKLQ